MVSLLVLVFPLQIFCTYGYLFYWNVPQCLTVKESHYNLGHCPKLKHPNYEKNYHPDLTVYLTFLSKIPYHCTVVYVSAYVLASVYWSVNYTALLLYPT